MSELRTLLANTAEKVLGNLPADLNAARAAIFDSGLTSVMLPESDGGFGGGWEDAYVVLRASGYHAVPNRMLLVHEIINPRREETDGFRQFALAHTCQMAGAMQGALDLSVRYVRERQQFGKPLASFQAIQQQLAVFAEECAATSIAAAAACRAADRGPATFEIAAAKLRANMAVTIATGVAHQVHGAMGFTAEYRLQALTRQLWTLRKTCGNDRFWARELGAAMAAQGSEGFWATLVSPTAAGTLPIDSSGPRL